MDNSYKDDSLEGQQHKQPKTQIDVVVDPSSCNEDGISLGQENRANADPKREVIELVRLVAGQKITPATARALFKIADGDLGRIEGVA